MHVHLCKCINFQLHIMLCTLLYVWQNSIHWVCSIMLVKMSVGMCRKCINYMTAICHLNTVPMHTIQQADSIHVLIWLVEICAAASGWRWYGWASNDHTWPCWLFRNCTSLMMGAIRQPSWCHQAPIFPWKYYPTIRMASRKVTEPLIYWSCTLMRTLYQLPHKIAARRFLTSAH